MEKHHIEVMLSEEKVDARIKELGEQISRDYAGKSVHLICILKGSVYFTCELAKRITVPITMDFLQCSRLRRRDQIQRNRQGCERPG